MSIGYDSYLHFLRPDFIISVKTFFTSLFERTASDERLRPYFYVEEGEKVLNEAAIITEKGEVRRPDRIVFKSDHVMIIDYKTGREYKDKYEAQLSEYKDCMEKMGYQDVRTEILYID